MNRTQQQEKNRQRRSDRGSGLERTLEGEQPYPPDSPIPHHQRPDLAMVVSHTVNQDGESPALFPTHEVQDMAGPLLGAHGLGAS